MVKRQLPTFINVYLVITSILSLGVLVAINNLLIDILYTPTHNPVDKLILSVIITLGILANISLYIFIVTLIII